MNIVITSSHHWPIPTPVRTGHIVILDLAIALEQLGHAVSLCAPAGTKFSRVLETEATEGRGEPSQPEMERRALEQHRAAFDAADVIHDISTDMTIARAYPQKSLSTPLGGSWDSVRGCPNVVLQSHSHRERALRGATDYEGTEWPDLAGPPQRPVREARVVHNGVDTDWYRPGDTPKEGFFLWLGRWSPQRGYKLAIDLAKRTGIELVMSGERPADVRFEPERRCAVEATELARGASNIRFEWLPAGEEEHQRAKRELYRRAKAFLMVPRFQEPFGLQQVEALACGTPVVAVPMGSIPEVLEHGVTGLVVEPAFLHQACDKIGAISPETCRSEAARRFDRRVMATEYVKLYEAVCRGETW
jgi:glycosyltransferase involved in cell wall biosynthesis